MNITKYKYEDKKWDEIFEYHIVFDLFIKYQNISKTAEYNNIISEYLIII